MEKPHCIRCGADKKEVCKENTRLSCSSWGIFYGRHLWSDSKANTPHQPEKQSWEERFDEIFVRKDDGLLIIEKYDGDTLKIFIHSLLQEERDKCKNFLHVGKGQQCEHGGYNFGCGICLEALLEKERKAEREKLREVLTKEHYGKEHYGISDVINKEV